MLEELQVLERRAPGERVERRGLELRHQGGERRAELRGAADRGVGGGPPVGPGGGLVVRAREPRLDLGGLVRQISQRRLRARRRRAVDEIVREARDRAAGEDHDLLELAGELRSHGVLRAAQLRRADQRRRRARPQEARHDRDREVGLADRALEERGHLVDVASELALHAEEGEPPQVRDERVAGRVIGQVGRVHPALREREAPAVADCRCGPRVVVVGDRAILEAPVLEQARRDADRSARRGQLPGRDQRAELAGEEAGVTRPIHRGAHDRRRIAADARVRAAAGDDAAEHQVLRERTRVGDADRGVAGQPLAELRVGLDEVLQVAVVILNPESRRGEGRL